MGCIYKATNKVNGMIYIGQTWRRMKDRINEHSKQCNRGKTYFSKALHKYGLDNFDWDIVFESDSKKELDDEEIRLISNYREIDDGMLYNITDGGQYNVDLWSKPGHREFIIECQKKAWTDERKRIFRIEKNPSAKKVMCLETGEVFECARDACRKYSISAANISMCCYIGSGKKHHLRSTAGNKHWIFYEKDLSLDERLELIELIGVKNHMGDGNPNARKVECIETGIVFGSMKSAALSVNGVPDVMKMYIRQGKKYKGFTWKQIEK